MAVSAEKTVACALLVAVTAIGGCGIKTKEPMAFAAPAAEANGAKQGQRAKGDDPMAKLEIFSRVFAHEGPIPTKYTCEGEDVSPPLSWKGVPEDAESLALIVDDPDAPDPANPKMTWVHWVLYDIPTSSEGLDENARTLPGGTKAGLNDWKRTDYGGPCPPVGRHRYFFKLYALDIRLSQLKSPTKAELEKAMQGHILDQARMIGTYQKAD